MARQQARRRHRERLTGIVLAVLGVVVLVVAVIALNAPDSTKQTAAKRSSSAATTSPTATAPPSSSSSTPSSDGGNSQPGPSLSLGSSTGNSATKKLPLVVLNNTTTNGLATQAAASFRNGGWTVSDIANLSNTIISTCAYYDPDVAGAEAAAKALRKQFPAIKRVTEKFSELPSGPIVVVLTPDYNGG